MKIYKGCNQEVTVQIAPCCIDVEGIDNLVLNFYTIGDTSIEFSGDSITRDGKNATVVFQPAQLELLPDGIIRYVSTFDMDEEEKVYDMSTTYYLKTPANYETQHFVTEENMMDYIEGSEELKDYIDDQVSEGIEPVEEAMSGLTQNLENLSGSVEDLSASTVSGLTELDDKFSGYTTSDELMEQIDALTELANSKIPKPGPAGKGSNVDPIYIDRSGNTQFCRVSTTTGTRWNALVATDAQGNTHAGRIIVFHRAMSDSNSHPQLGKLPTVDGFTTYIIPTGDETNELTNENQRYLVDSRDWLHIKKISYDEYTQMLEAGTLDAHTIYRLEGDEHWTNNLISNPRAYNGKIFDDGYAEGTIVFLPGEEFHIDYGDELPDGTYPVAETWYFRAVFLVEQQSEPLRLFTINDKIAVYFEEVDEYQDRVVFYTIPSMDPLAQFYFRRKTDIPSGSVSFNFDGAQYVYSIYQQYAQEKYDNDERYELSFYSTDEPQRDYVFDHTAYNYISVYNYQAGRFYWRDFDVLEELVPFSRIEDLETDSNDLDSRVVDLENEMLEKQDELVPGYGIAINGNEISCTLSPESGISSGVVQTMIDTAIGAETSRTESTYAKSADLSNYSTTAETHSAISSALTDYSTTADTAGAISSALTGYATESWVQQQGYITGVTPINDAGNNYTPVYVSGGTVVAADTSYPGRRWGVPMFVNPSDGGVEGGAYLDFHNSANTYSDYAGRIRKRAETAGFSFVYDVSGQETNPLASNEYYAVDSRHIMHIVKLGQASYDNLSVKDDKTLYIIV
jgi:hypothetical protein